VIKYGLKAQKRSRRRYASVAPGSPHVQDKVPRIMSTAAPQQSSRWVLALTILTGQITLAFSMFAVAVALPNIMSAMSADGTNIHWVMTGFQIARTVPMPAMGWCSSLLGHRRLYITGLTVTVVSTICCGLAWNLESLIFFRVVQGLSAAPAQVTGMVILYEAFPPGQRGLVLGLLLLAGSLGPTIGPSLGGYLVQEYSWRAMFFLSLPTAVLSLILTPIVLPKIAKPTRPAIDAWGLLSMAIWVVALLLAVGQGQRHGWDATYILSLFAIAGVFFVVFLLLELLQKQPFVDLRLYCNRRFIVASMASLLFDAVFNSANFLVAFMLQQAFHYTPFHAGLMLAPGAMVMGVVGLGAGRLADLMDPRGLIALGFLLQAIAMYYLAGTSLDTSAVWFTACIILYRMSLGCVQSPLTSIILKSLPPERLSMGSGLDGIHRGFASAFGIALGSMLVERRLMAHEIALGEEHELLASSVSDFTGAATEMLMQAGIESSEASGQALAALWSYLRQTAQIAAYQDAFLVLCGITLLALVPAMCSGAKT
jgi:EmrB/QacA subfamily drug resistance transporter